MIRSIVAVWARHARRSRATEAACTSSPRTTSIGGPISADQVPEGGDVFITIDVDGIDPSLVPA